MTDTIMTAHEPRQRLHEIVRKDIPFKQKAREALELSKQYLGVDIGYLTRIDQETNHLEIIVTTDSEDGQIPPGLELDLQETYCRETIEDDIPFSLHDAPNQGWEDDPAFKISGNHTYLGIPLVTEEEPYGTVCFSAQEPRSESFSEAETQFADHLTRLLERELEKELIKDELTNQTNLSTVLHRVLRHNLRNEISIIRGYTALMADQADDDSVGEVTLNKIDELIDLSQKARELEEVITTNSERQPTELTSLIETIVAEITQEYPAASISVEYDNEIQGRVLQNFDRAMEELIENAVKHSDNPCVTVAIEMVPNGIEIQIRDNGPGLPDHEAEVLNSGVETALTHGSGLGLWLVYWIVSSHDGSIDPEITECGTKMKVTIPRKPDVTVQQQVTELTRSRDKYKTSFEQAADAIAIVTDEGRIIDANEAASALFGIENNELLGRSLTEFFPEESAFDTDWLEFQETGDQRDTTRIIGADGAERIIEYSVTPDIIAGQHLFISRDITERRERDRELEVAETVFQTNQDALFVIDVSEKQEFYIERVNAVYEEVTGLSNEEIVGKTPTDVFDEEIGSEMELRYRECVERQEPINYPGEIPVDGEQRQWETNVTPVISEGQVDKLVGAMRDVHDARLAAGRVS